MPLTPKCFISRLKNPFCSDHIGEKIIVVRFFLDFLWIFKLRKIRATVVHRRDTRRMGRVGLYEGHRSDAKQSLLLACLFHLISVRGVHLPSFATTLVFLIPFHLVLTRLHQPLVHSCIKQVNSDRHSDRLSIPRFYLASLQCLRCYSPGENR